MTLDNSLNNDIQAALSLHCAITAHLDDNDICTFSFRTPSTIVSGIRRIYNNAAGSNVPCLKRIVQDCKRRYLHLGLCTSMVEGWCLDWPTEMVIKIWQQVGI